MILKHLVEFKLTSKERFDLARRKIYYLENKDKIFERSMKDAIRKQKYEELSAVYLNKKKGSLKSNKSFRKSRKKLNSDEHSVTEIVEALANEVMEEYENPFDTMNVVKKDGCFFSFGNMVLCSLNVAYNELTYSSVKLLETVLNYQSRTVKPARATGLMRVILDGNFIPKYCDEYDRISMNLKKAVGENFSSNSPLSRGGFAYSAGAGS